MWDGCVEIVHGFDTKDGWVMVGACLLDGWKMVVYHFAVVESWLEGRTRWESGRGGQMKRRGTFAAVSARIGDR